MEYDIVHTWWEHRICRISIPSWAGRIYFQTGAQYRGVDGLFQGGF
ncbi:MAG: hypothetical protein HF976_07155 [ANME-2 cluster archaeon]|nr:hypothetical protein [ANME-2 cluster archaeon]MBC2701176.1 hypothetical protein [ANME-2 cluster archaeon]MBC2707269.1 hypothetical protein [ANME-2 cluster archaeon]